MPSPTVSAIVFLMFSVAANAEQWLVVPVDQRHIIDVGAESSGADALCPDNMVMTGRWHKGDENKPTKYECGSLRLYDPYSESTKVAKIRVTDRSWTHDCGKESSCGYIADGNRIITGRKHTDDEQGPTRYQTGLVVVNDQRTNVNDAKAGIKFSESNGQWWRSGSLEVMVGRQHWGDENGDTQYHSASIVWTEASAAEE